MPFALVTLGLIFIVTGAKDTQQALGKQLKEDFTGPGNFVWWIISIGAVGSLGYVTAFRTFSRAFMALILIAMVLANGGFFDQFMKAIQQGPVSPERTVRESGSSAPALTTGKPGGAAGLVPGITSNPDGNISTGVGNLIKAGKGLIGGIQSIFGN